ncbi:MAG: ABC transporter substrate-binding protein [Chloroflexi bacterium]|nr:ABC transporter substrate-binding protein [Chloroflexota bacterium]
MGRRLALRLIGLGAGVGLLAACAPASPQAPASAPTSAAPATTAPAAAPTSAPTAAAKPAAAATTAPAATTAAAPAATTPPAAAAPTAAANPNAKPGGTLRTGLLADISSLDGHLLQGPDNNSTWLALDRLTRYDDQLEPQPMLAESWKVSPNQDKITFKLRQGVQWHTGREFTSDDVKWNFNRIKDTTLAAGIWSNYANWFSVDTPDKYTAVLTSDKPRPSMFDMFEYFNMLDPVTMQGPDARTMLVGTGPFKFVEWVQNDHITLTKNPNYWQSGRPYLDGVQVTINSDPSAAVKQIEGGGLDFLVGPPLQDFTRLKSNSKYAAVVHPFPGTFYLIQLNVTMPPFDNKMVRQAMNYALDRKRIADTVLQGTVMPKALPWPPSSPAYDEAAANSYQFDLDKAQSMLTQAGVSTPLSLDMLPFPGIPELIDLATIYQSDLAKIGVNINMLKVDVATWLDQANNRKYKGFNTVLDTFTQISPFTFFTQGKSVNPNDNNSGFKDDTYSSLIEQAGSEPDAAKRKAIYMQLNQIFLDESFMFPVAAAPARYLATSSIQGIGHTLHEGFTFTDAWIQG